MTILKSSRGFLLSAIFVMTVSISIYAGDPIQPSRLVNGHTAGVLDKGHLNAEIRNYAASGVEGSGLLLGLNVGITNRFTIGLSYGGEGIIGYGDNVRWNPLPGALVKYRLIEESFVAPAITLGFDNQGYGGRADSALYGYNGYVYKAPGFFAAVSKSYVIFKKAQIGFHGTANYSLEDLHEVTWPNALAGIDIGINEELMFVVEYNFALDDMTGKNPEKHYNPFNGFLNMGLRWAFTENFHLQFDVKDLLQNKVRRSMNFDPVSDSWVENREPLKWSRELKVIYVTKF